MIFLPDAENCTIVSLFVRTKHGDVTDGQTDIIALAITAVGIASSADSL